MRRIIMFVTLAFIFSVSCQRKTDKKFIKLSPYSSGVDFSNTLKSSPELNILAYLYYYNGAGVLTADFNNDDLIDLYFVGNQSADELYLNQGGLQFKKITQISGIDNAGGWTTGATHVDINNDGLLDIYLCKASGYRSLKGKNLLYVNQGLDKKGIPSFKEVAQTYNLDFSGLSTQAAFFDYDVDGDLDLFLLKHSVHPNRNYGRGSQRKRFDPISGDRLFQNNNGKFEDVSTQAGIFQGKSGYGLGLSIGDLNNDSYPDIYVGNDFFENDYLYINQKDGTYKEIISADAQKLGHTTHFSMGNEIVDINNDGRMDIISLDMLPDDLNTYKTSALEYAYPIYIQYLKQGFAPQFMQNTLHLNLGNNNFSEIANLSGVAATEWSWGAIAADFDNDGYNDLFVSNGIKGASNDMDYMNFIANEDIQRRIDQGLSKTDMPLVEELPEKKVLNYFFKNNGDLTFSNETDSWLDGTPSFSNGCTYADLDNDGDLDIVVNNINEQAHILENTKSTGNYLKVKLNGSKNNRFGIGTKLTSYSSSGAQTRQHFISKGYLSASSNIVHFGLGKDSIVDSLRVVWPNGKFQVIKKVKANQQIHVQASESVNVYNPKKVESIPYRVVDSVISFAHKEQTSLDFDREPLVPYANSNNGPDIIISDINADGYEDLFICGGKTQPSELFLQNSQGNFTSVQRRVFEQDALSEDVAATFFDADGDKDLDLLVVSGGNEFKSGNALQPRLYLNDKGVFKKETKSFQEIEINASNVVTFDYNGDNALDIFIASDTTPGKFGESPKQYILQNDGKGNFIEVTSRVAPEFEFVGNVKDIQPFDFNLDGLLDFVAIGHWMPITIFVNNGNGFSKLITNSLRNTEGWWNTIEVVDFDNDGDDDLFCGNWGENTKFSASKEKPITLYRADFDSNGSIEPLVTYYHKNVETTFASKDELVKQLPFLNKEYLSYQSFADATIHELFGGPNLEKAKKKQVYQLTSSYFENTGDGNFTQKILPKIAQASSIHNFLTEDFDNDGNSEVLIVGNDHQISTQLGRLDALHGVILQSDENGSLFWDNTLNFNISGAFRTIRKIKINGTDHLVFGRNGEPPIFLAKTN